MRNSQDIEVHVLYKATYTLSMLYPTVQLCYCMELCHHLPDTNAMLLPGRVPGYKDSDVKLLPSSTTKHAIWELYLQAASTSVMRAVVYSTFTQLWHQLLPNIVVMKPMSDLCWICQQNSTAIMRSANCPEEKSTVSTCV